MPADVTTKIREYMECNIHTIEMPSLTCCHCFIQLAPAERNNLVTTEFDAYWSYPALKCVFDHRILAVAFRCDKCESENKPVLRVPEWIPKQKLIRYHSIEQLKAAQQYKYIREQQFLPFLTDDDLITTRNLD